MKFTITYKVLGVPKDMTIVNLEGVKVVHLEKDVTFSLTYQAEINQLGDLSFYVNEYLQQFFAVGNYEIISMKKAEELEVE